MRRNRIISISVFDESRLHTLLKWSCPSRRLPVAALFLMAAFLVAAVLVVAFTPLRRLLPGSLDDTRREAVEQRLLRLDSLQRLSELNAAYLADITRVADHLRPAVDTAGRAARKAVYSDSLLAPLPAEARFVASVAEREKFNLSVIAPLAGGSVMFYPPDEGAVAASESRGSMRQKILMPPDATVGALADGTVVAVYYAPEERGYSVVTQHGRGFLSRYSRLGSPLVAVGDVVAGGQALALPLSAPGRRGDVIYLEMWHNGTSLPPSDYILQKNH